MSEEHKEYWRVSISYGRPHNAYFLKEYVPHYKNDWSGEEYDYFPTREEAIEHFKEHYKESQYADNMDKEELEDDFPLMMKVLELTAEHAKTMKVKKFNLMGLIPHCLLNKDDY